jgi:enamine deaminase RidA (YjgF/YER057c/UK114 family)
MSFRRAIEPGAFDFFDYKRYTFSLGVDAGDQVWLAGHLPSRYDPALERMVVAGDVGDQARLAHAMMERVLAEVGLTHENVVKITDYVTPAGMDRYGRVIEVRHDVLKGRIPAVSTVIIDGLLNPEAQIEVELVAAGRPVKSIKGRSSHLPWTGAVRVGDFVHVSSQMALDENGIILGGGNLVAQTTKVYRNIASLLEAVGSSTGRIVKTVEFLHQAARPEYKHTAMVRREFLTEPWPAATGVVVSRLPHPDALIQVEALAYDGNREVINPGWTSYDKLTYSPAVRAGEYIFLAGRLSLNPTTLEPEYANDLVGQTRNIYRYILTVLEAVGLSYENVIKTVEYIVPGGLAEYRATADVRRDIFTRPYPAATGVVVPQLVSPQAMIEIEAVAMLA